MKREKCIYLGNIVNEKGEKGTVDFLKEISDDELSRIATNHLQKRVKVTEKNREKTILDLLELMECRLNRGWVYRDSDCSKVELIKWY